MIELRIAGEGSSLPTDWQMVKLGQVLQRVRGPVEVKADKTYHEIGIRSHGKGIFYKEPTTGAALGEKAVFWVQPDCFIVNIVFAWEQAVAKTTTNEVGMIASHRFPMYKPKEGALDLDYVLRFFKTPQGKYLLGLASPGGAGRNKTLGQEAFLDLSIPLPPYLEQRKIAAILGTWDEAIALTERRIAAGQQRKQGLMQRLLTGQVRIPEFSGQPWRETTIEDVADVIMGQSPASANYNDQHLGIPLIQGNADIANRKTAPRAYTTEVTKRCKPNDIILSVRAPVGSVALSTHEACIGRGVCAIRTRTIDLGFLYQMLLFIEPKWGTFAQGSTFTAINGKDINQFGIRIPQAVAEQHRVAEVLTACDGELDLLARKRDALQRQKRGLMQQLLTGRVRVKGLDHGDAK